MLVRGNSEENRLVAQRSRDDARKSLDAKQEIIASGIPSRNLMVFMKAVIGEATPRQAIKAKCQSCVGWENISDHAGQVSDMIISAAFDKSLQINGNS